MEELGWWKGKGVIHPFPSFIINDMETKTTTKGLEWARLENLYKGTRDYRIAFDYYTANSSRIYMSDRYLVTPLIGVPEFDDLAEIFYSTTEFSTRFCKLDAEVTLPRLDRLKDVTLTCNLGNIEIYRSHFSIYNWRLEKHSIVEYIRAINLVSLSKFIGSIKDNRLYVEFLERLMEPDISLDLINERVTKRMGNVEGI